MSVAPYVKVLRVEAERTFYDVKAEDFPLWKWRSVDLSRNELSHYVSSDPFWVIRQDKCPAILQRPASGDPGFNLVLAWPRKNLELRIFFFKEFDERRKRKRGSSVWDVRCRKCGLFHSTSGCFSSISIHESECNFCGQIGHWERECPLKPTDEPDFSLHPPKHVRLTSEVRRGRIQLADYSSLALEQCSLCSTFYRIVIGNEDRYLFLDDDGDLFLRRREELPSVASWLVDWSPSWTRISVDGRIDLVDGLLVGDLNIDTSESSLDLAKTRAIAFSKEIPFHLRVYLIGDSGVGKTTLLNCLRSGRTERNTGLARTELAEVRRFEVPLEAVSLAWFEVPDRSEIKNGYCCSEEIEGESPAVTRPMQVPGVDPAVGSLVDDMIQSDERSARTSPTPEAVERIGGVDHFSDKEFTAYVDFWDCGGEDLYQNAYRYLWVNGYCIVVVSYEGNWKKRAEYWGRVLGEYGIGRERQLLVISHCDSEEMIDDAKEQLRTLGETGAPPLTPFSCHIKQTVSDIRTAIVTRVKDALMASGHIISSSELRRAFGSLQASFRNRLFVGQDEYESIYGQEKWKSLVSGVRIGFLDGIAFDGSSEISHVFPPTAKFLACIVLPTCNNFLVAIARGVVRSLPAFRSLFFGEKTVPIEPSVQGSGRRAMWDRFVSDFERAFVSETRLRDFWNLTMPLVFRDRGELLSRMKEQEADDLTWREILQLMRVEENRKLAFDFATDLLLQNNVIIPWALGLKDSSKGFLVPALLGECCQNELKRPCGLVKSKEKFFLTPYHISSLLKHCMKFNSGLIADNFWKRGCSLYDRSNRKMGPVLTFRIVDDNDESGFFTIVVKFATPRFEKEAKRLVENLINLRDGEGNSQGSSDNVRVSSSQQLPTDDIHSDSLTTVVVEEDVRSKVLRIDVGREVCNDVSNALDELESQVRKQRLVELHCHLMGMGTPEFWMKWIMGRWVPNQVHYGTLQSYDSLDDDGVEGDCFATALSRLRERMSPTTSHYQGDEDFVNEIVRKTDLFPDRYDLERRKSILRRFFTDDVVYPCSTLLQALTGADDEKPDQRSICPEDECSVVLERLLTNENCSKVSFRRVCRSYIVFSGYHGKFEQVVGIPNEYLLKIMEYDVCCPMRSDRARAIEASLRNCFGMLNRDGSEPKLADLCDYRGSFTPKFYPQRFVLKDPLYKQVPIVVSILLNVLCTRMWQAGLRYAEFSISWKDAINERMSYFLSEAAVWKQDVLAFAKTSSLWKKFRFRFLMAFPRTCAKFPDIRDDILPSDVGLQKVDQFPPEGSWEERLIQFLLDENVQYVSCSRQKRRRWVATIGPVYRKMALQERRRFLHRVFDKTREICEKIETAFQFDGEGNDFLMRHAVGFDLVSDEDGNPFCPFVTEEWLNLIVKIAMDGRVKGNGVRFGVRLHAGEGVQRGSSAIIEEMYGLCEDFPNGDVEARRRFHQSTSRTLKRNFAEHMNIVFDDIKTIFCAFREAELDGCRVRIGHGIAFLHRKKLSISPDNEFFAISEADFPEMRKFLKEKMIPCEINLTSNNYLLGDVFLKEDCRETDVQRVLARFLQENMPPVILSTDNDGIWALHKCEAHHRHICVAHEFCLAVMNKIMTKHDVREVVDCSSRSAFFDIDRGENE